MLRNTDALQIYRFFVVLFFGLSVFFPYFVANAIIAEELKRSIEEKAKGLLEINNQIQQTQKQIEESQSQQTSLKKEIQKIDYSVNQLNLSIKSSQINIEKLSLELQGLQYEINDINASIGNRKLALIKLLRELYEKDNEGTLVALLKNKSLAETFLEQQSLSNLNNGLSIEVESLKKLHGELDGKFQATSGKKQRIESENKNLKNRKFIVEDQKSGRQSLLAQTKNQEKLYNSLLDDLSKRQAEISKEIETIESELRSKIDPSLLPIPRPGVLAMPVAGFLSQNYGKTPYSKYYKGDFHNGIDIAAPIGTEVWAAEGGRVVANGNQDTYAACRGGAYGKFIVVEHENNLVTLYAHLSGFAVQAGDIVKRGQVIGYVGRTGYATGPHLHFTVYAGPTFYMGASRVCGTMPLGGYINPLDYLAK